MSTTREAKAHVLAGGSACIPEKSPFDPHFNMWLGGSGHIICEALYHGAREKFCAPPESDDWELR